MMQGKEKWAGEKVRETPWTHGGRPVYITEAGMWVMLRASGGNEYLQELREEEYVTLDLPIREVREGVVVQVTVEGPVRVARLRPNGLQEEGGPALVVEPDPDPLEEAELASAAEPENPEKPD
jgi:hypothetical protein